MRARVSIPAWAKAGLAALSLAACTDAAPCSRINANIERVRAREVSEVVSDRVRTTVSVRRARPGARIVSKGAFTPIGHERLHQCLGAEWRGDVEGSLREGWSAPAIVYARDGWPNVVLLDDGLELEVRIESAPSR